MGRRVLTMLMIVMVTLSCAVTLSYGSSDDSDKKCITVQENLPAINIYCDRYDKQLTECKNIEIQAFSDKTELENSVKDVHKFDEGENYEGITYFILIDTSTSMNSYESKSFDDVKNSILKFTRNELNSKDKVFILPFSDEVNTSKERGLNPTTLDIEKKITSVKADGNQTNIYNALGEVTAIAEKIEKDTSYPERKVALLFTDAREFNDGGDEKTARDVDLVSAGIGIYAFTIGDHKADKDMLREFIVDSGGTVYDNNLSEDLKDLERMLQNSLVITTEIKNVSDMVGRYDIKVFQDSNLIGEKSSVKVPNTKGVKDAFSVVLKKGFFKFWWIILIIAIAVIAAIVLRSIKKNKGVVDINGKVVFGSNISKKYHIKRVPHESKELVFRIESSDGNAFVQNIDFEGSIIVGRSSICDVYFDDAKMSRQHFVIEEIDGNMYIDDLESKSGTYLNSVRVYEKQKLSKGDIITAGATKIVIENMQS